MSVLWVAGTYLLIVCALALTLVCAWRFSIGEQKKTRARIDRMNERIGTTNEMPDPVYDFTGSRIS